MSVVIMYQEFLTMARDLNTEGDMREKLKLYQLQVNDNHSYMLLSFMTPEDETMFVLAYSKYIIQLNQEALAKHVLTIGFQYRDVARFFPEYV